MTGPLAWFLLIKSRYNMLTKLDNVPGKPKKDMCVSP